MPPNRRVPRRVAIVDDSAEIRELLTELLQQEGPYEVQAFTGSDANPEDIAWGRPGVVILDIRLDEEDRGWQLLGELRGHPDLSALPIVISTADTAQLRDRRDELATMPGVFILEKPFALERLEQLVECAMKAAGARDA